MAKETISQTEGLCKEVATCIRIAYDKGYKQGQKDMEQDTMAVLENGKMIGREEAWECCRKLFATMPEKDIEQAFYTEWHNGGFNALMNLNVTDAIRRIEEYEKKKKDDEIKVGDEVTESDPSGKGIVTRANEVCCYVMWADGSSGSRGKDDLHKTGKHIDGLDEILKQLQEVNK